VARRRTPVAHVLEFAERPLFPKSPVKTQESYHWPLYGLGLSDQILKKVCFENAQKILDESARRRRLARQSAMQSP
jgi:hypothetical protein